MQAAIDEDISVLGDNMGQGLAEGVMMGEMLGLASGFYISPIAIVTRGGRIYRGSRAEAFRDHLTFVNTLIPFVDTMGYCLTHVIAPQAVHNQMMSSVTSIYAPPMTASTTWGELPPDKRAVTINNLENQIRLPMDSVGEATILGNIVKRAMCLILCSQRLQADFPLQALNDLWATVPVLQQLAIIALLDNGGIATLDILPTSPIRFVLDKLASYPFGTITIGGESF